MFKGNNKRGFTLIEVILATVILCGAVLALGAISTRSLSSTHLNSRYETAANLADKQLTIIDSMGIDTFISKGIMEGFIEDIKPGYHWQVETEWEGTDNLYIVTITLSWKELNKWHSVTVETMMNGRGTLAGIRGIM